MKNDGIPCKTFTHVNLIIMIIWVENVTLCRKKKEKHLFYVWINKQRNNKTNKKC